MIKFFTHNLVAKIICILLAVSLWIYIISMESKTANFPGNIALEVRNTPQNLVVIKDLKSVEIKLSADRGTWNKLSSKNFSAYIDVSGLNEGIHEVPIQVNTNMDGVQIIETKPTKMTIRLEPVVTKNVPVQVRIEGVAAEGMIFGDVTTEPNSVDIQGAKFYLDHINSVYLQTKINGESENILKSIKPIAYDNQGNQIEGIIFKPAEIKVNIPIIKGGNTKTVGISVKTIGNVKEGYWVSKVSLSPSTVVITANPAILANIDYIETSLINIANLDSDKFFKTNLNLPDGVNISKGTSNEIEANFRIASGSTQKQITADIEYLHLNSALYISKMVPDSVKILISGPVDKLQNITTKDVKVNFDLTNYTKNGNYSFDITKSMIEIPAEISISNIIPNSITLILNNK